MSLTLTKASIEEIGLLGYNDVYNRTNVPILQEEGKWELTMGCCRITAYYALI
jgi:hypothetical protein